MAPRRTTKKTPSPEPAAVESPVPEVPAVEEAPTPKARKAPARAKKAAAKEPEAPASAAVSSVPAPVLPAHAETILAAIQTGRAVELIFVDADANPPRTFEPRQLSFEALDQAWFVWGWDRRYNAERHHRLELLAEVNVVEGVGRSAQGPYKEGIAANQIGGWLGGEPIQVKATLLKQWIFAVRQAPAPFPEFTLQDQEEGKALVSFVATDLRAIARWCMQFGDGLQVLEPQRLVDRIKQVGVQWGGKPAVQAPAAPKAAAAPRPEREKAPEPARRQEQPRRESEASRREPAESSAPKAKPGKVELRVERL